MQISWTYGKHILCRVALGLLVPFLGIVLGGALLVGRLQQGPLDITGLSHRWVEPFAHIGNLQLHWGRMALAWQPRHQKHPSEISFRIDDVRLVMTDAHKGYIPLQAVDHAQTTLNFAEFLHGKIAVRELNISGVRLSIQKTQQGQIHLEGVPPDSVEVVKKPSQGSLEKLVGQLNLPRHIDMRGITIDLHDEADPKGKLHFTMPFGVVEYQQENGWHGQLAARLENVPTLSGKVGSVTLNGDIRPDAKGGSEWVADMSPLPVGLLAAWLPMPLEQRAVWQGYNVPVSFHVSGRLSDHAMLGDLAQLSGRVHVGEGQLILPQGPPIQLVSAQTDIHFKRSELGQKGAAVNGLIQSHLWMNDEHRHVVPLSLQVKMELDHILAPQNVGLEIQGDIPAFDFATLGSVWPEGAARGARRWITTNMTSGSGEKLHILAKLHGAEGFRKLLSDQLEGDLYGHNLTVWWLRPIQPVTGVEAHAHFLDADQLQIDVQHGHMQDGKGGEITLPQGKVIISGLSHKRQEGRFELGVKGSSPGVLNILAHPRLKLLSRHPVRFTQPEGYVTGTLNLGLPLIKKINVKDITYGAELEAQHMGMMMGFLGHISQGQGHISVKDASLIITGGAHVWGVPVRGEVFDSFHQTGAPGQILVRADLKAPLSVANLHKLGVPAFLAREPVLKGQGQAHVQYTQYAAEAGHRQAHADIQTDFTAMTLKAPFWQKLSGVPAGFKASLGWDEGHLTHLDNVQAYGPRLSVIAQSRMRNGQVGGLEFQKIKLGRSEGRAVFDWPLGEEGADGRYMFDLQASLLDATSWWGALSAKEDDKNTLKPHIGEYTHEPTIAHGKGAPSILPQGQWSVNLRANTLLYGAEQRADDVKTHVFWSGQHIREASLEVGAPNRVSFHLSPVLDKVGEFTLGLDIANTGAVLSSLGVYQQLEGGRFSLRGKCAAVTGGEQGDKVHSLGLRIGLPPCQGEVAIKDMTLKHPPAALVMATVFAPLHWGQLSREQFETVELNATLYAADGRMQVEDGRASNDIFGGTLKGQVDFTKGVLDMQGTLSPLFGINHAAGTLFGEGTVMAPEKGSGVMAMTYRLDGTLKKPEFHVNPFSVLLPGSLRNILDW